MKETDKKTAILETTMDLITENGFHATPMSMVASKAKVAAGTIYHYFPSKEDLINEIYALAKERMGNALMKNDDASKSYKERFMQFWMNLYSFFSENTSEFRFLEQYANSPFISQETKEENEKFYKPVITFLEAGIKAGTLRPMNAKLMVNLIYGNVATVIKLKLSEQLRIDKKTLNLAMESSWDSVKA